MQQNFIGESDSPNSLATLNLFVNIVDPTITQRRHHHREIEFGVEKEKLEIWFPTLKSFPGGGCASCWAKFKFRHYAGLQYFISFLSFFFINETFFWQNIEMILSFHSSFWFSIQSNLLCLSLSESRKTFQIKLMQHQLLLCGSKSCKKSGQISNWNGIWKISKRYIESARYHLTYF